MLRNGIMVVDILIEEQKPRERKQQGEGEREVQNWERIERRKIGLSPLSFLPGSDPAGGHANAATADW